MITCVKRFSSVQKYYADTIIIINIQISMIDD